MRPWPKGCSLSTGFWARRMEISEMMLPPASERLLAASAVTATEPVNVPTRNFTTDRSTFTEMPTTEPSVPYCPRTRWSEVFSGSRMKRRMIHLIMLSFPPFTAAPRP